MSRLFGYGPSLRPRAVAALGFLGAVHLAASESRLTVENLTPGAITVVRTCDPWQPGQGAYAQGKGSVRRHLKAGETATFTYQTAGKEVDGRLAIRNLGENGLIHHDGFTIRCLRPGGRIPAVGAESLTEGLPAVPEDDREPDPDDEARDPLCGGEGS